VLRNWMSCSCSHQKHTCGVQLGDVTSAFEGRGHLTLSTASRLAPAAARVCIASDLPLNAAVCTGVHPPCGKYKEKKRNVWRQRRGGLRVRRGALTQRRVTTNRGCYSLRFFGSLSNSMSRAFSFEEKHSRGDRPKRQAPDCGDHCESHEQHALTIALWTQTYYSPLTHSRLAHDAPGCTE
jgi:hypothetical protein